MHGSGDCITDIDLLLWELEWVGFCCFVCVWADSQCCVWSGFSQHVFHCVGGVWVI